MNLPNSITLSRIFSIPLLVWILSGSHFSSANGEKELLASALFIAAAMTDGIDGYLARKRDQITTMGILLDPIADKLLIAAAFRRSVVACPVAAEGHSVIRRRCGCIGSAFLDQFRACRQSHAKVIKSTTIALNL